MQHDKILSTNNLSIPTKREKDTINHKVANYNNSLCIHTLFHTAKSIKHIYCIMLHETICTCMVFIVDLLYIISFSKYKQSRFNISSASFSLMRFTIHTKRPTQSTVTHCSWIKKHSLLSLVLSYDTKQNTIYIYTHKQRDAVQLQHCHCKQLRSCNWATVDYNGVL